VALVLQGLLQGLALGAAHLWKTMMMPAAATLEGLALWTVQLWTPMKTMMTMHLWTALEGLALKLQALADLAYLFLFLDHSEDKHTDT
jgi:hypothetical protein